MFYKGRLFARQRILILVCLRAVQKTDTMPFLRPTKPSTVCVKPRASAKSCDLWKKVTQTVFGEGGGAAPKVMLIGEQPGDQEDLAGKPFVGPAGKLLDAALVEAGIDRRKVYVTNAVKHFKWEPRGNVAYTRNRIPPRSQLAASGSMRKSRFLSQRQSYAWELPQRRRCSVEIFA